MRFRVEGFGVAVFKVKRFGVAGFQVQGFARTRCASLDLTQTECTLVKHPLLESGALGAVSLWPGRAACTLQDPELEYQVTAHMILIMVILCIHDLMALKRLRLATTGSRFSSVAEPVCSRRRRQDFRSTHISTAAAAVCVSASIAPRCCSH